MEYDNVDYLIKYFKEKKNIIIVKNKRIEIVKGDNSSTIYCSYWKGDLSFNVDKHIVLYNNEFLTYIRSLKVNNLKRIIDGN